MLSPVVGVLAPAAADWAGNCRPPKPLLRGGAEAVAPVLAALEAGAPNRLPAAP